jgi:hypothetical protein
MIGHIFGGAANIPFMVRQSANAGNAQQFHQLCTKALTIRFLITPRSRSLGRHRHASLLTKNNFIQMTTSSY